MIHVMVAVTNRINEIGLQTVLDAAEDIRTTPYDADAGDIPSAVAEHKPDVLLLDVAHRRADAGLVPKMCEANPNLRVLVLVDHSADECGIRHLLYMGGRAKLAPEALAMVDDCCLTSLRQQALGCLASGAEPAAVLESVRAVSRGEIAAAPWLTIVASTLAGGSEEDGHAPISAREIEVMALLAEGLSNKQIAKRMDIREQTVKNHVGHLMEKLGVKSRLEAGIMASKHHLMLADD